MKKIFTFQEKLEYFEKRATELKELQRNGFDMSQPAGQDWNTNRLQRELLELKIRNLESLIADARKAAV